MHRQRFTSSGGVPGDSRRARRLILLCSLLAATLGAAEPARAAVPSPAVSCVAFSPYSAGYNPNTGPHPSAALIQQLLDRLIQQTSTKCIMTYGVLNGLDATFAAARQRGIADYIAGMTDRFAIARHEELVGPVHLPDRF